MGSCKIWFVLGIARGCWSWRWVGGKDFYGEGHQTFVQKRVFNNIYCAILSDAADSSQTFLSEWYVCMWV